MKKIQHTKSRFLYLLASLKDNINLNKIFRNIGWLITDKFLKAFVGLFVGVWVARYLGPSEYGRLTHFITFIAFFQSIANLGIDGIVVRDISRTPNMAGTILGTALLLKLAAGLISLIFSIVIYCFCFGSEILNLIILIIVGFGLILQASDTADLWFQSQSNSKATVICKSIAYLFSSFLRIILILLSAKLFWFAIAILVEMTISAITLYFAYRKYPSPNLLSFNITQTKKLLLEGWPYLLSGISIFIYMKIDQLIIISYMGESYLGLYSAIMPLSNIWNVIPVCICLSISPFMSRLRKNDPVSYKYYLVIIFRAFWIISIFICLSTYFLANHLVFLLYGDRYDGAGDILKIYVFTNIPIYLGVAQTIWVLNESKPYVSLMQALSGALVSISFNLLLIPAYGLQGAAITAIGSLFVTSFLINAIICKELFFTQLGFISVKLNYKKL